MNAADSRTGAFLLSIETQSALDRRQWQRPVLQAVDIKDITASGSFSGNDFFGQMMMSMMSDRRLKRDIQPMGVTAAGLPVYVFRYLNDEAWWLGTIAQDVLRTHPDAVSVDGDGRYSVDYTAIDVPVCRM